MSRARLARSSENDARHYLLYECVDAYLLLEGPEFTQFVDWLDRKPEEEVTTVGKTLMEYGEEKGVLLGERRLLRMLLEKRFGPLGPLALQRFDALTPEQVREMALSYYEAQSLQDLGLAD